MFPVEDDFGNAFRLLHCRVLAPVGTADGYHPASVHAKKKKKSKLLNYNVRQPKRAVTYVNEIPFKGLFCMFWRNVHTKVLKGLHELPKVNAAFKTN